MSYKKIQQGLPPHKMSLLIDIEQGRPFEVEVITGAVLRLAQQHGLETPNLALIYSLMKGLQVNILKQKAARDARLNRGAPGSTLPIHENRSSVS